MDFGVPVTLCSFRASLHPQGRSEIIAKVVEECGLTISQTIKLLMFGFRHNFDHHSTRSTRAEECLLEAIQIANSHGFKQTFPTFYFPKKELKLRN